jgi:signal transduction histidine kinase
MPDPAPSVPAPAHTELPRPARAGDFAERPPGELAWVERLYAIPRAPRLALALLAVLGAFLLRVALVPLIEFHGPYLTVAPVAMLAALVAGTLPGLAASAAGALLVELWAAEPSAGVAGGLVAATRTAFILGGALVVGRIGASFRATHASLRRQNEELEASRAQARDADRRKTEFLGMLSHELRNPLAPIRYAIHLLERAAPEGAQARRAVEVIARQSEHLTRLVDDLLDVTRIARGKIELRRAAVDLRDVVRRTAEDLRPAFDTRGLALDVRIPGAPAQVDGDPTRLAQVVGNLLQNAAKFTPSGGHVTLELVHDGGAAELRVRDTGVGIEPELLSRVFEPFVQGERSLARTQGGLGLGLALVKGIAELHGGSVLARSDGRNRGAELTVRLPLAAGLSRRSGAAAG